MSAFMADADRLAAMLKEARQFASARGWLLSAHALAINPVISTDEPGVRHIASVVTGPPTTPNKEVQLFASAFFLGVVAPGERFAGMMEGVVAEQLKAQGFDVNGVKS